MFCGLPATVVFVGAKQKPQPSEIQLFFKYLHLACKKLLTTVLQLNYGKIPTFSYEYISCSVKIL